MVQRVDPKSIKRRKKVQFENCSDCGTWTQLDHYGRCEACAASDRTLKSAAKNLLATQPDMTSEEVAERLGVDESHVQSWVKEKRIHLQNVHKACPNCGRLLINRLTCDSCGYGKPPEPQVPINKPTLSGDEYRPPRRVEKNHQHYWDHCSEINGKHQIRRIWMVPVIAGGSKRA